MSLIIFGEHGDSGQLDLKKSETNFDKFEKNQTDIFQFNDILSLGELTRCRIWHDNSGNLIGNAAWHLEEVIIEDLSAKKEYKFPCNKWLSKSKDDKQLMRDLVCSNKDIGTPRVGEKTEYEVTIITSDKQEAGTKQNAWIAFIGENGEMSKNFLLENSSENKILRRYRVTIFFEPKN